MATATLQPELRMSKSEQGKRAVKIDEEIVSMAQVIAAHRKIRMADYLSELLRPLVRKDYARTAKEIGGSGSE